MKKSILFLFPVLILTACQKPQNSSSIMTSSSSEGIHNDMTLMTEIEQPTYYDYDSSSIDDASSLNNEVVYQNLSSVLIWINDIDASSISKIIYSSYLGSISPTMDYFNTHKDMTNSSSIADFVMELKSLRVVETQDPYWAGGGSKTYTLCTKDGEEYTISNYYGGFTHNEVYYEYESFINDEGKIWGETYYSFMQFYSSLWPLTIVYVDDVEHSEIDTRPFMGNVRFQETTETIVQDEKYAGYHLVDEGEQTLTPLTDTAFSVHAYDKTKTYTILNPEEADCSLLLLPEEDNCIR